MTNLTDYVISASILHTIVSDDPDVFRPQPSFSFYLLPQGIAQVSDVPIGSMFGLVSSPSTYHQLNKCKLWLYTRFQVVEKVDVRTGEFERFYRSLGERELTAVERGHFERIAADMVKERAAA